MEQKKSSKSLLAALSVLLCFVIFLSAAASVVVLDIRLSTSKHNIQRIVEAALSEPTGRVIPGAVRLHGGAILTGSVSSSDTENELVAWLARLLEEQYGDQVNISADQIQEFLNRSTVKAFLAEKIAGYTNDLLNDTNETQITDQELMDLIGQNKDLIETFFGIPVTGEVYDYVLDFVRKNDLNDFIRQQVLESIRNTPIPGVPAPPDASQPNPGASTLGDLLNTLRDYTSWTVFAILMAIVIGSFVGLFFTRGKDLCKAIRTGAIPLLVLGILLTVPTVLLQAAGSLLLQGVAARIAATVIRMFAFVHYGVLVLAVVLLIAGSVLPGMFGKKASIQTLEN